MPSFNLYVTLFRVSNLPTIWSNVLTALLLCGTDVSWPAAVLLLTSLSLLYSAGMALNDICDSETDKIQRSFRPIPSGRISLAKAWSATLLFFVSAFILLAALPHRGAAAAAAAILTALIILYDRHHKGNPLSVLLMAGCRFMVFIVSAVAMTGSYNATVVKIALLQFFYIVLLSLVARFENRMPKGFSFPLIPLMLAGICLLDGFFLFAVLHSPLWIVFGAAGMILTLIGQTYVRGD